MWQDLFAPFVFLVVFLPAELYKASLRIRGRELWVIAEGKNDARDNGLVLFEYIRTHHPEVNVYYAINKKSDSYQKVAPFGNIVQYQSLKHWIYYIAASKNISIHKSASPNTLLFYVLHRLGIINGHRVFLQHGVTMNDVKYLHYSETRFELFVCGAAPEYEYVKTHFGFNEDQVAYLGFPRFDKLFAAQNTINARQIVIMPTWRSWLGRETNALSGSQSIEETQYFKAYQSLINNKKFISFIEKNKLDVYFFQHANMEKYADSFTTSSSRIKIVTAETANIQTLLAQSGLMITDYSSVSIDFAFMRKPVLYFQFDEEAFRKHHLAEGYFSYRKDGFGPVVVEEGQLLEKVYEYFNRRLVVEDQYLKRSSAFFRLRDGNNSRRIFDKIMSLERRAE